jgi:phytoene synthase
MNQALAALVRRHDPDRFLTVLFAPPGRRDDLLALYAFNHELARAREVVSEPPLALIRLQWWREVVQGARRRHEVAGPLGDAIDRGALLASDLLPVIAAREMEAEPEIATVEDWRHYVLTGPGGLAVAAGRLLGSTAPEALRPLGAAYGVAGLLRSVRHVAAQGRCLLPSDLLAEHGLSPEAVAAEPDAPALVPVLEHLRRQGSAMVAAGPRRVRGTPVAAALPAVLARRDLARGPGAAAPRGIGDRLAVMAAALTGRIR